MKISIIIPTFNEAAHINHLLKYLLSLETHSFSREILVVDASSEDETVNNASMPGVNILISNVKSRAYQMNLGAGRVSGEVLYFLHADSYPPSSLFSDIGKALAAGYEAGCYRLRFDYNHWFLNLNTWFSKFNFTAFRYGDQSLFVHKGVFHDINGYDESFMIMEDHDIVRRICRKVRFKVMPGNLVTSARRHLQCGVFKLQFGYYLLYLLYFFGKSPVEYIGFIKY